MSYNTSFTRRKSSYLADYDCRPATTGQVRVASGGPVPMLTYFGEVTLDEAVEQGKCISMVRVPKGFKVTGATVAWTQSSSTIPIAGPILGLGDPYACGRLTNGPLDLRMASADGQCSKSFASCSVLVKVGRVGDGCGIGYTYMCDTDIILTNLYGTDSHCQGGWESSPTTSGGGTFGGAIPSGTTLAVEVRGYLSTGA